MLSGADESEPRNVLAVGFDGQLLRSSSPRDASVVGVYSTEPGFVGGSAEEMENPRDVPLAVVGVVPVKASAENGAIAPGDLLTSSSTPGDAMRADANPPVGTVIGKALEAPWTKALTSFRCWLRSSRRRRMSRQRSLAIAIPLLAALLAASTAWAALSNGYDLSWWTVDGGRQSFSTGGDYTLGGTIGQPDAGVMSDSSGTYTLSRGFWGGTGPVQYAIYLPLVLRGY